ncbi:Atypical kinase COQ8 [Drechslerella dactyloides]|uniref:Atypical kinase COQ8 n=1 Tax=Drechslerella dactyloides TaxID=74499 RepID=A0AAD6NNY0_DREDA|nr:Atypical kinase COQ8 [Drechslerella dactyloides]
MFHQDFVTTRTAIHLTSTAAMASRLFAQGRTAPLARLSLSRRHYSIKPTTLNSAPQQPKAGLDQDHHYTPTTATTPVPPSTSSELPLHQASAKERPLPDGTVPDGVDTIPSTTSETPVDGNLDALNADIFRSRRARVLANAPAGVQPSSSASVTQPADGINGPEFTAASAKVEKTAAKVVDDMKKGNPRPPFAMSASAVPSSQLGRLFHYGGLAAGMTIGALNEGIRRATGSEAPSGGGLVLNPQNIERLVRTLSKMRGAALKLGQMLSFQDSSFLPPAIQTILTRVQNQADYMPPSQRDAVLSATLGANWRSLFASFDETPIAAASIGQVHTGTLSDSDNTPVAIKIQYPGVADSISSDLNNLSILLTATRLLPRGLFLDKTIANARTELAWECDYLREAAAQTKFATLTSSHALTRDVFTVPRVFEHASGKTVLTMSLMSGTPISQIILANNLPQEDRDWLGTQILQLCLLELAAWGYMQTDPNWSNFLYSKTAAGDRKIALLDFGASREFPADFLSRYLSILRAAAVNDTTAIRDVSVQLGYLTGLESEAMLRAHIASIVALAEPFAESAPTVYDFAGQTVTDRVRSMIPVMVRERLRPPPEETYSLHRKLSGAFLLCARLGSRVRAREMFEEVVGGK